VVRALAGSAGVAILYVAWFVYEDEEKLLQSKIESWWLQFDDLRQNMISRHAAFISIVAQKAKEALDRLFGPILLATDSVAVATSLGVTGVFLVEVYYKYTHADLGASWEVAAIAGIAFVAFVCGIAPLASARFRRLPRVLLRVILVCVVLYTIGVFITFIVYTINGDVPSGFLSMLSLATYSLALPLGFVAGIALTLLQIVIARRAMELTVASKSEWPIIAGMFLVSVPIGIVISLLVVLATKFDFNSSGAFTTAYGILFTLVSLMGVMSIIAVAFWLLIAGITSVMVFHRITWPLASRVLYALPRYRVVEKKKTLNAVGIALLGVAISGATGWQVILKHFAGD
jgi:hypothetical protein